MTAFEFADRGGGSRSVARRVVSASASKLMKCGSTRSETQQCEIARRTPRQPESRNDRENDDGGSKCHQLQPHPCLASHRASILQAQTEWANGCQGQTLAIWRPIS